MPDTQIVSSPRVFHADVMGAGAGRDDTAALQRCIDAAIASTGAGQPIVRLNCTKNDYLVTHPLILDSDNISLEGTNGVPTIVNPSFCPTVVIGVKRNPPDVGAPTDGHRKDAYGIMDASYAPARGVILGYQTYDSRIVAVGKPAGGGFCLAPVTALGIAGATSPLIPWNAPAGAVQAAVCALPQVGAGNFQCTGGPLPDRPISYQFIGNLSHLRAPWMGTSANCPGGGYVAGQSIHLAFSGHPWSHPGTYGNNPGKAWRGTRGWNFDLALYSNQWKQQGYQPKTGEYYNIWIEGICDNVGVCPYAIGINCNPADPRCYLYIGTRGALAYDLANVYTFSWPIDLDANLLDMTGQINLNDGTVSAWSGGKAVPVRGPAGNPLKGAWFRDNEMAPFLVGFTEAWQGILTPTADIIGGRTIGDYAVLGRRSGSGLRYKPPTGPGDALQRLDNIPVNHAIRYADYQDNDSHYLTLQDPAGSPFCDTYSSVGSGCGLVVTNGQNYVLETSGGVSVKNIKFSSRNYGYQIDLGDALYTSISGCSFDGGFAGIGAAKTLSIYPINIDNCSFANQSEAPLLFYYAAGNARNLTFTLAGARAVMVSYNYGMNIEKCQVYGLSIPEHIIRIVDCGLPGGGAWRDWLCDFEGGGPIDHINIQASGGFPGNFIVDNWSFGSMRAGAPAIVLRGGAAGVTQKINVSNCVAFSGPQNRNVLIDCQSAVWAGVVDESNVFNLYGVIKGIGAIISRHAMTTPPASGLWTAGRHLIHNPAACRPGDAIGWVCTGSGADGNSPTWAPIGTIP